MRFFGGIFIIILGGCTSSTMHKIDNSYDVGNTKSLYQSSALAMRDASEYNVLKVNEKNFNYDSYIKIVNVFPKTEKSYYGVSIQNETIIIADEKNQCLYYISGPFQSNSTFCNFSISDGHLLFYEIFEKPSRLNLNGKLYCMNLLKSELVSVYPFWLKESQSQKNSTEIQTVVEDNENK